MIKIRYFSFIDPITGEPSKTYGISRTGITQDFRVKHSEGKVTVDKNESSVVTWDDIPSGPDVVELSKEEFDNLDTSKESLTSKLNRETVYLRVKKIENAVERVEKVLTSEELVDAFSAGLTAQSKTLVNSEIGLVK